jgi:hypothetical protein
MLSFDGVVLKPGSRPSSSWSSTIRLRMLGLTVPPLLAAADEVIE